MTFRVAFIGAVVVCCFVVASLVISDHAYFIAVVVCYFVLRTVECKSKTGKQVALQSKETNVANFMRLFVMRLIFGVASAMGLGENLSGVLGGIFVPPGAEDEYGDDYGDDYVPDLF